MGNTKIFVRHKQTYQFLNEQGSWVETLSEARTYKSTWDAYLSCKQHSVPKAEIVMRMGDPQYDVIFDVQSINHGSSDRAHPHPRKTG